MIDTKGKLLLPITYDEIGSSNFDELNSDGLNFDDDIDIFRIESNEKYGYANTKGEIIVNPTYDSAGSFSEGYADVCNNEKYGFIDQKVSWSFHVSMIKLYHLKKTFVAFVLAKNGEL